MEILEHSELVAAPADSLFERWMRGDYRVGLDGVALEREAGQFVWQVNERGRMRTLHSRISARTSCRAEWEGSDNRGLIEFKARADGQAVVHFRLEFDPGPDGPGPGVSHAAAVGAAELGLAPPVAE